MVIWESTVDFENGAVISGACSVGRHTIVSAPVYATYGLYVQYRGLFIDGCQNNSQVVFWFQKLSVEYPGYIQGLVAFAHGAGYRGHVSCVCRLLSELKWQHLRRHCVETLIN